MIYYCKIIGITLETSLKVDVHGFRIYILSSMRRPILTCETKKTNHLGCGLVPLGKSGSIVA